MSVRYGVRRLWRGRIRAMARRLPTVNGRRADGGWNMVRSFFCRTLLAGAALAVCAPALADVKAGVDAWSRGDYATAIGQWRAPADKGDSDAQFNLGQAYKLGRGVPQDLRKAEELFAKAAAQGHMPASDNYGLLLYQRGEHARAMPYIASGADRGDPRAQYLLGLAYFNGENVTKDWVRAYALVSLAQRAGLAQAVPALAEMDRHIPLAQRQQSVKLATQLDAAADANRARLMATVDLGGSVPSIGASRDTSMAGPNFLPGSEPPKVPPAPRTTPSSSEYRVARTEPPRLPPIAEVLDAVGLKPAPAAPAPARAASAKAVPARTAPAKAAATRADPQAKPAPARPTIAAPSASGVWRVQLGAFGVAGNADALWNRVRNRPELAGHDKILAPAGRLQKLQAGGFASQGDAQAACRRLISAGFTCIPVRS